MELIPLPFETVALTGFTHKARITFTDLKNATGAGTTTVTLPIFPDPDEGGNGQIGMTVQRCAMTLPTAFVTTDGTSLVLEVGDGGDVDRFLTSTELLGTATEIVAKISAATTLPHAYTAADTIDAKFTVSGGASPLISELTAGVVEIYLHVINLNNLQLPR